MFAINCTSLTLNFNQTLNESSQFDGVSLVHSRGKKRTESFGIAESVSALVFMEFFSASNY